jgi:hypothetical protein
MDETIAEAWERL